LIFKNLKIGETLYCKAFRRFFQKKVYTLLGLLVLEFGNL